MTGKRPRSGSPSTTTPADDDIYTSEPILDRQSTFIAHYSPTLHAKALQKLPDLATASHRMAAWRFPSNQRTITANSQQSTRKQLFETGRDDDGEKGGGRALEKLMESMQVTGSVMVARWYGGVMLGPVRFTHIETCAMNAVKSWQQEQVVKKRKLEQDKADQEDKISLPETLEERDRSIAVLRQLLEQKKAENAGAAQSRDASAAPPTPSKKMDYTAMPVESLRKLESARDSTIAFLLKQIDAQEDLLKANKPVETAVDAGSAATAEKQSNDQPLTKEEDTAERSDVPTPTLNDAEAEAETPLTEPEEYSGSDFDDAEFAWPPTHQSSAPQGGGALADYQMQLMLNEQQNRRRAMMAAQEREQRGHQMDGSLAEDAREENGRAETESLADEVDKIEGGSTRR